ncbi:MAG: cupin domain-containing protein [Bacillota bacterium]|nr:cupin domain-containing protein [Bacillota bacterium]
MIIKNISESIKFNQDSFTKRILYVDKNVLSFVLNFKPGQTLPVHKHENSTVAVNVLSGNGQIKINQEVADIQAGSFICAEGQDEFSVPLVNEDMTLYICISPNPSNEAYSKNLG